MTVAIQDIRKLAALDIAIQIDESGDVSTPDGGWDSWLINGIGSDDVCKMFGEPVEENQDGWSEAMKAKLIAYNEAGLAASRGIAASHLLEE